MKIWRLLWNDLKIFLQYTSIKCRLIAVQWAAVYSYSSIHGVVHAYFFGIMIFVSAWTVMCSVHPLNLPIAIFHVYIVVSPLRLLVLINSTHRNVFFVFKYWWISTSTRLFYLLCVRTLCFWVFFTAKKRIMFCNIKSDAITSH